MIFKKYTYKRYKIGKPDYLKIEVLADGMDTAMCLFDAVLESIGEPDSQTGYMNSYWVNPDAVTSSSYQNKVLCVEKMGRKIKLDTIYNISCEMTCTSE